MNMNKKQYDERQLQVRGQVFFHGFFVAVVLLLLNAFLQSNDIVWASPFNQNILIVAALVAVVSIELILRGAYFGQHKRPWVLIGLFGILSVLLAVSLIIDFVQGEAFIDGAGLSEHCATAVFAAVFITITITATLKTVVERRKDN
jgi:hypothetical protein